MSLSMSDVKIWNLLRRKNKGNNLKIKRKLAQKRR